MSNAPTRAPHWQRPTAAPLREFYDRLRTLACEAPPERARHLYIAGRRCGWATLAACDALAGQPQVRVAGDALHVGEGLQPGPGLDALLARVALALREARCLRGWRDELLDVSDDEGRRIGSIERAATRPLGLLTRAVHLNAWTPDGRMWAARRALDKSTDPGMWDTLVGGLASSAERLDDALLRECNEEAGLEPAQVQHRSALYTVLRMQRRLPEGYQVEDLLLSTCVLDPGVVPANRDGEVMEIATMSPDRVLQMLAAGEFTLEAALVIMDDLAARAAHASA
jgi:isopentenyldiphosphate isomerase